MKNCIKMTLTILGALIGAGFASGQEINIFFYSYGTKGIEGILISSIIIGLIIYKTLKITKEKNINNYKEYLQYLIPNIKNEKIRNNIIEILNNITNIFILITFYIMVAGFGTYLKEKLNIPQVIGSLILSTICMIILSKNTKKIIKINEIIVPILIIFILIIGIINFKNIKIEDIIKQNKLNWIIGALIYATYNGILIIPTIISIKETIKKEEIKKTLIVTTILISILILSIYFRN